MKIRVNCIHAVSSETDVVWAFLEASNKCRTKLSELELKSNQDLLLVVLLLDIEEVTAPLGLSIFPSIRRRYPTCPSEML